MQSRQNGKKDCQGRLVDDRFFPELYHRIEDQDTDADTDAGEGVLDDSQIRKVLDEGGNDRNDDQGREYHAQGGDDASGDTAVLWPTKVAVFTAMIPGVHCPMA